MGSNVHSLRTLMIAAVVAGLVVFAVLGCGGSSGEAEEGEESAETLNVPASLGATESDAEGVVELALLADRAGMRTKAAKLKADADDAASGPLADVDVGAEELRQLRERAARVDELAREDGMTLEVALAANAVSALMPRLFAHFEVTVPPEVLELDYLEREVELRSRIHEDQAVSMTITQLRRTWQQLRPQVIDAGGKETAALFAKHVAALQRLRRKGDESALQREARNGLELVDGLERVFA
jgi:hypothetical protein